MSRLNEISDNGKVARVGRRMRERCADSKVHLIDWDAAGWE